MSRSSRPAGLISRGLALLLPVVVLPFLADAGAVAAPAPDGSPSRLFTSLTQRSLSSLIPEGADPVVEPSSAQAYRLDPARARAALSPADDGGSTRIALPDPTGTMVPFAVTESSVMQPGLAAAHPEISTYVGRALDGSGRSISTGVTRLGFFASVREPEGGGSWYIDPAYRGPSPTAYLSYYGAAVAEPGLDFVERGPADVADLLAQAPAAASRVAPGEPVVKRTYRLAFVTDPTYAAYFGTDNVLSAKVKLLARTNQIYNDDLAIGFVLVEGTDELNLDTVQAASRADGPCGANPCYDEDVYAGPSPAGCSGALLTRTEFVLGQLVGADSYDVGHIGLGVNGGGIAGLGVVGGGSKASGCTGLPAPTGDFYAVDYFSHEVGHQMGANHTFDGDQNSCSATNRNGEIPLINPSTAVEPGSGSTVMAYAGICGQDNLQPHSDPYFSHRSIDEIDAVVTRAPGTVTERQTVTLRGFDTAEDSFRLTYPERTPVTLSRANYNLVTVAEAVRQLTGCPETPTDYDAGTGTTPSDDGFTVAFTSPVCAGTDLKTLGVEPVSGDVSGSVGVQDDGGPADNQGSTVVTTTNRAPQVSAPADKTIPLRTPFTLTGSATDADGDPLTYLWEQNDPGGVVGTSLVNNTKTTGPLFRVFGRYADVSPTGTLTTPSPGQNTATGNPSRTFPDQEQILAGNTNARTGACPAAPAAPAPVPLGTVECFSEFLPTAAYGSALDRSLTFRLTARDQAPNGGGTQSDEVTLAIDAAAGPFLVTSRSTPGAPAPRGGAETVTWDVAGTATEALAPTVRISLSTDGGRTFPTELAAATPNDGSETVRLPVVDTAAARIRVEAVGNYFFDVNDATFTIGDPVAAAATAGTAGTLTGGQAARVGTTTRLRLVRRAVPRGIRPAIRYAVAGTRTSVGAAGRVVVRVDGRRVRTRAARVEGVGARATHRLRLPSGLAPGRHRVTVRFRPTDAAAYQSSRSRTVVLTVRRR